ncbi:HET domain-containing protein [Fusarium sp. LHS14.1]|nr:HET domain-containing protein [Fusarium sp. LHS14.1]
MVWQRAHWRHPDTPSPRLQALIDIFRDWQCTDVRDKVFALVSMASPETAIIPDYSKSTLDVHRAVQNKHDNEKHDFYNMLSQILAILQRNLGFDTDMIEYKRHSPEHLVLRNLLDDCFRKDSE